jgi:Protein of unknown function (DUF1761)
MDMNILVATIVAFIISSTWYAVFGSKLGTSAESTPPWKIAVELLRSLTLALVIAWLVTEAGIDDVGAGLALGLTLWIGFPLVLWVGAMIWEKTPWRLAAIHGGDWLVKLLALSAIVSVWN